ncbi:hypothetical protein C7M84_009016 [Penaeus vannamei]|uniref:Uncharacterized protein n=1 Tax=Penaeus vannamei TaxID=6689 RepID=A0A3R7QA62_PENVA|nr:hypothetical protein C7M84_009016 [Penaeus vannamei]
MGAEEQTEEARPRHLVYAARYQDDMRVLCRRPKPRPPATCPKRRAEGENDRSVSNADTFSCPRFDLSLPFPSPSPLPSPIPSPSPLPSPSFSSIPPPLFSSSSSLFPSSFPPSPYPSPLLIPNPFSSSSFSPPFPYPLTLPSPPLSPPFPPPSPFHSPSSPLHSPALPFPFPPCSPLPLLPPCSPLPFLPSSPLPLPLLSLSPSPPCSPPFPLLPLLCSFRTTTYSASPSKERRLLPLLSHWEFHAHSTTSSVYALISNPRAHPRTREFCLQNIFCATACDTDAPHPHPLTHSSLPTHTSATHPPRLVKDLPRRPSPLHPPFSTFPSSPGALSPSTPTSPTFPFPNLPDAPSTPTFSPFPHLAPTPLAPSIPTSPSPYLLPLPPPPPPPQPPSGAAPRSQRARFATTRYGRPRSVVAARAGIVAIYHFIGWL